MGKSAGSGDGYSHVGGSATVHNHARPSVRHSMESGTRVASDLKVSPIFYATLNSTARRVIHQGGQWSGKTVNILIALAVRAKTERNRIITVTGQTLNHLKTGAMRDFIKLVYPYFAPDIVNHNKTDNVFTFRSGSIIEFRSFEDEGKALGAKRDYLFVNEADRFNELVFFQLDSRTDIQTIIDYNPSARFWAHEQLIGEAGNELHISDHRHNPFLSPEKHAEVEGIKNPERWRVYARGLTGNVDGLIFPDWQKIADADFPWNEPMIGGLDFGYTKDPTAGVRIVRLGDSLFVHELMYSPGIHPTQIKQLFQAAGFTSEPVYCEHDPEQGAQLRRLGGNWLPAKKGVGSIKAGIQKLHEYKVYYTASSTNLHDERGRYTWLKDKNSDKFINEPVDQWNHLLDAVRYGVYSHWGRAPV